jgi:predicted chitinase
LSVPLTIEVLRRCGVPPETARANLPFMISAMREFGITSPPRARMFLAQVLHESMRLTRFEEIDSGARYEGNKTLGNTQPGDGERFKGRGPIQITGRWNYTHFGKLVGLDLIRRPELAAVPRHGWRLAAVYFEDRGCNDAADRGDFREVTRLINAGLTHFEERHRFYELLSKVDVVPPRKQLHRRKPGTKRDQTDGDKRDRPDAGDKRDRADGGDKRDRANGGRTVPPPPRKPATLPDMVAEFNRLEAHTDHAWERLAAQGRQRRRSLTAARAAARDDASSILLRIEDKLEMLLELERGAGVSAPSQPASTPQPSAVPSLSGKGAGQTSPGANWRVDLENLSDTEIVQRIDELEGAIDRTRAALIRRYLDADKELSRSGGGAEETRRGKSARDEGAKR